MRVFIACFPDPFETKGKFLSFQRGMEHRLGFYWNSDSLAGCSADAQRTSALDLAFLMDASGSLYHDNYEKEKEFVRRVVDRQTIGRDQTRVSIMTYSKNATVHVKFNDYFTRQGIKDALNGIPYESQNTRIDRAMLKAKDEMFTTAFGARPYAKRVCIFSHLD